MNKMRTSNLVLAIIGTVIVPISNATTIGFSPAPTARLAVDSSSIQLPTSSLVWAGNFTNESFTLNNALSLQDNISAIQSAGGWEQFGLDTLTGLPNAGVTGPLTISAGGKLGGTVADNNLGATKADYFNNKSLYVWIFNAATVLAATEMGIFRSPDASNPWTFPTNAGGIGDLNTTLATTVSGAPTVSAIGGVGSTSSSLIQLTGVAPVPEPSTFAGGAVLAMAAMVIRRRRRG